MRARFFCLELLAGVFALLVHSTGANALSITQTLSFDLTAPVTFTVTNDNGLVTITPSFPVPSESDSDVLTFSRFDTTLGNLTAVTITFATTEYSATVTVVADNQGINPATFFSDATMDRSLTGAVITVTPSQQTFNANCATDPNPSDPPAVLNCNDSTTNNVAFSGTAVTGALSSFNGPGTFDLTAALSSTLAPRVTPDNGTDFAGDSTFSGSLAANWKGNVEVEYEYNPFATPVPEPMSLYLLTAGLGGIALAWRRR